MATEHKKRAFKIPRVLITGLASLLSIFVFTVASAKPAKADGYVCHWKNSAQIHCESSGVLKDVVNNVSDVANGDLVDSRASMGYWTRTFRHNINDKGVNAIVGCSDWTANCREYYYSPTTSLAVGYPVFRRIHDGGVDNQFLHFPDPVAEPMAAIMTNNPSKVDKSRVAKGAPPPTPVIKPEDATITNTHADMCSIEQSTDCNVADAAGGGTIGNSKAQKAKYEAFLAPFRTSLAAAAANAKCSDNAGALGFVICPLLDMTLKAEQEILGLISDQLVLKSTILLGSHNNTFELGYKKMLNIANALYVLIFIVIIFGNSLSLNVDAYTIKKTLPKLVGAIIISQFAYYFMGALIDLSNVLGGLVQSDAVFGKSVSSGLGQVNPAVAGIGVIFALLLALFALVAGLIGFVVIAIRKVIIYILVLAAPIAIAASILPGTDKAFKFWRDNFIKLLLMYPMIAALLAGSVWVSSIILSSGGGTVEQIIAMLLPLMALLYLPKTLKWSGKLMASTGGAVTNMMAGKAKGAYQKSAKEGTIADKKGKALMATGDKLAGMPVLGGKVGAATMKKGAALKGAAAKSQDDFFKSFDTDDLKKYITTTGGKGKLGKAAATEYSKRVTEQAEKQRKYYNDNGEVDFAGAVKLNNMQEFKYGLGGEARAGSYFEPTTGRQTGEIKLEDNPLNPGVKTEIIRGVVKGIAKNTSTAPTPPGVIRPLHQDVIVRQQAPGAAPGPAPQINDFPKFE